MTGRLRVIVILGALSAFAPLSIDMYLPALPKLAHDFDTGASQVQLTLTACLVGLALGQLLAGPVSDALGRRRPLLVGIAVYTLASAACAFAPTVYALAGLRLLQGLGGGAGIVISRAVVRDLHSGAAAARLFSLLLLVNGTAPILAPVIGAQLLRVTSWRAVFGVLAGIGLLLLVAAPLGLRETLPRERRSAGGLRDTARTFGDLISNRLFASYALTVGLGFGAMFAYISASPFVLQDIYGASPQLFSAFFAMNAIGLVGCGQLNGLLVYRVPLRRLLHFGSSLTAAGGLGLLAAVLLEAGLGGVLAALFVTVASLGFVLPNATALALSDHPTVAGSAAALLGGLQLTVGAAVAPLVGIAGKGSAVPMAIVIAVLATGCATVRGALVASRGR